MTNGPRIAGVAIVFDCRDPERLARFWRDLFGWKELWRNGPYIGLIADEPISGVHWLFQRVSEPKVGKNRSHGGFLVMADPEGNEFCLVPEGEFRMDEDGNVDYLPVHLRES